MEYESKKIFKEFGIPLVKNIIIKKSDDFGSEISKFNFPAIIKSQIAIGSRKKAGLIKIAQSREEAIELCKKFFNTVVSGYHVEAILIEELVEIKHEYYCSIALDSSGKTFFLIASSEGGINIEEVAKNDPNAIFKHQISLKSGLDPDLTRKVSESLGFKESLIDQMSDIFLKLWKITTQLEAQLVEVNPLVLTPSGIFAVDGKMVLDENAAYRQPITQDFINLKSTELEKTASKFGFSFLELEGDVAILANGAGLTIALLDVLSQNGLNPANFLDLGGGANKDRVCESLKLLFRLHPKAVLVNIYGGITRCDIVAEAIVDTLKEMEETPPIVIRLAGTKEAEGVSILKEYGVKAYQNMMEAVNKLREVMA